jgi:DNA polymerase-4
MPNAILHLGLRSLPGIGPNMAARLNRAGISDMATLWAADGQRLRHIWGGIAGLKFHELLHGENHASIKNLKRSLGHQHVLAPDQRDMGLATETIRQLLIRAAQRLRAEGLFCRCLILNIKWLHDFGHYACDCRFHETQDTGVLLRMLKTLWDEAPRMRPLRIGVMLLDLVPQAEHQPDLFDRPKPARLTQVIDSLNAKFGRGAVSYGAAVPDMVSKIAFQRIPDLKEF